MFVLVWGIVRTELLNLTCSQWKNMQLQTYGMNIIVKVRLLYIKSDMYVPSVIHTKTLSRHVLMHICWTLFLRHGLQ